MQQNMTGTFSVPCSQTANLSAYLRVKIDPTYGLALAGATDREIGVLANTWVATGLGSSKYATLCGTNAGTAKYVANGAISQYAACFAAANGQIGATGTIFLGWALDVATANGDVIRVARDFPANQPSNSSVVAVNAAAGSNQATAVNVSPGAFSVIANNGAVILTGLQASASYKLKNTAAGNVSVYPPVGGAINAGAVNAALVMATNTACEIVGTNASQAYSVPCVPS